MPTAQRVTALQVFYFLYQDGSYTTLAQCARVNRELREAASFYLYRRVFLAPPAPRTSEEAPAEVLNGSFKSACLPHNTAFVREVSVYGLLCPREPSPHDTVHLVLRDALQLWKNLRDVTLAPYRAPRELFDVALPALLAHSLRSLTVRATGFSDATPGILVRIKNLESLTIMSPNRAILKALTVWLPDLAPTLSTFRLMDACRSITLPLLQSFIPHLQQVHTFALGLSYSLMHDDVFAFLEQLPRLRTLDILYFLNHPLPTTQCYLPYLQSITVRYDAHNPTDFDKLLKWFRQISSQSPLASVKLVHHYADHESHIDAFDEVFDHLGLHHGQTLRSLKLEGGRVDNEIVGELCQRCIFLEELDVCVRPADIYIPELRNVRVVKLRTKLPKRAVDNDYDETRIFNEMLRPPSRLQRLEINRNRWQVSWTSNGFRVERTLIRKPHGWEERQDDRKYM